MAEEKTFKCTVAERGYIARLVEVAAAADQQIKAVNAEFASVITEAKDRLGLHAEAQLFPDTKRMCFVLVEGPATPAPVDRAAERGKVNGVVEPVAVAK